MPFGIPRQFFHTHTETVPQKPGNMARRYGSGLETTGNSISLYFLFWVTRSLPRKAWFRKDLSNRTTISTCVGTIGIIGSSKKQALSQPNNCKLLTHIYSWPRSIPISPTYRNSHYMVSLHQRQRPAYVSYCPGNYLKGN